MLSKVPATSFVALLTVSAMSKIQTQVVEYKDGDVVLQGFAAWDDAVKGPRPGVAIVHDWNGLDAYEEGRARQLAELGYVALALDIYGKGVRPKTPQESGAQALKYRGDVALYRSRLKAGVEALAGLKDVDAKRMAAIGYCFGGGGVLEAARAGLPLVGVVSFHGGLGTSMPATSFGPKILMIHASDDPAVPQSALLKQIEEFKAAKADYQIVIYNLAAHAFTVPGAQYNAAADRRSWEQMKAFFGEVFAN